MMKAVLLSCLLSLPAAAATRVEVHPGFFAYAAAAGAYSSGAVWVATRDALWRFGPGGGAGESVPLPERVHVSAILPRGDSVDLVAGSKVLRLIGEGFVPVLDYGGPIHQIAAVEGGWVRVDWGGTFTLHREGGERRTLEFAIVDGPGSAGGASEPPMLELGPDTQAGDLVSIDAERVAWVDDSPYRIRLLGLDGTARILEIDESEVEDRLALGPTDFHCRPGFRRAGSRRAALHEGLLFLDRIIREVEPVGGVHGIRPRAFVDVIDLESGRVVKRIRLGRSPDSELGGHFVGMQDDRLVLYQGRPEGEPSYLVFASWREAPDAVAKPDPAPSVAAPDVRPEAVRR